MCEIANAVIYIRFSVRGGLPDLRLTPRVPKRSCGNCGSGLFYTLLSLRLVLSSAFPWSVQLFSSESLNDEA